MPSVDKLVDYMTHADNLRNFRQYEKKADNPGKNQFRKSKSDPRDAGDNSKWRGSRRDNYGSNDRSRRETTKVPETVHETKVTDIEAEVIVAEAMTRPDQKIPNRL